MSPSDRNATDPHDQFTEQLSALLARTAQYARPNHDLARRVRQSLASAAAPRRAQRAFAVRFPSMAPIGSAALVALLLVAFIWMLTGHGMSGFRFLGAAASGTSTPITTPASTPRPTPTCDPAQQRYPTIGLAANPADHSVALGASASDHGITVTVDRAYADATQTVLTYSISPDKNFYSAFSVSLIDASGARYGAFSGGSVRLSNSHYLSSEVFTPLPQSALGSPQRLNFHVTRLMGNTPSPTLNGLWDIPFTITPVAGTAVPLSLPAQTHDGVTIQLEEMDVAPVGGGLDGQSGGVRVRYRVSNLPATASLSSVTSFPRQFSSMTGSSGGRPGGALCHDLLTLKLANGQEIVPGSIRPTIPFTSGDLVTQAVGASGSVEAEAVFFAPVSPGNLTMSINSMPIGTTQNGKWRLDRIAQGPWVFTVRLLP